MPKFNIFASGDATEMRALGNQLIAAADKHDVQKQAVTNAVNDLARAAVLLRELLK